MQQWKIKALTYLSSIFLYRWYALAAAWALCLIGWGVVAAMPDQYQAEAKVYIDTDNLMDPLLKGLTVSIDPAQEIAVMLKTLITRPTLEQVVRLTSPTAAKMTPIELEQKVQDLQNRIAIRGLETRNYYAIGYTDNDAQYATAVTQSLLSIMQDSRVGGTRLDMDSARAFIAKKVQEYEERLRDADKRRADFRAANLDILSKGVAANRITTADTAYEQARKDLNSATVRRDSVKEQLAALPKEVPMDERMFMTTTVGGVPTEGGMRTETPLLSNPVQRLEQAQTTLAELRTRYTDSHPDVVAQKKLITQLEAQLAAKPDKSSNRPSVMVPNPVYSQLQTKLSDEETNVAVARQHVSEAATELSRAKQDASQAIDVQARYDGLERDYGNIQKTYSELLQSREAASLSQARDDQNQGVSFRVLEPPQLPRIPAAPNRLALNSLVLVLGIGGGAAIAVLLALNSGRFFTSEDITAQFGIPLIGVITALPQPFRTRRSRLSAVALSVSVVLLLLGYVGVVTMLRTSIYSVFGAVNG
jgi:polysaccharide chain length determinant protein (PEP-CTERM system associated)